MRYHTVFLTIAVFCSFSGFTQHTDEKAILKIMHDQEKYWNLGDLDNFVTGYWQNDSVMFIGSKGVIYGYNNTLNRYKKSYPNKEQMGMLKFTVIHLKPLSPGYYYMVGKFHLTRAVGDLSGHFTLLFQNINGEWKIIADHSS